MTDSLHCRFQAPVSGNDDDLDVRILLSDILEKINAPTIRKSLVECDKVDRLLTQDREGRLRVFSRANTKERAENDFSGIARACLIVHDQDRWFFRCVGGFCRHGHVIARNF